ncbi:MAG TPA: hypothetical protein VH120_15300 [Gemmataceae bacterium]|nr:hypothetical protein [Gemmataceae bacterium]
MRTVTAYTIKSDKQLAAAVDEASSLLETILGRAADTVTAEWSIEADPQGRKVVLLKISDWTGAVSTMIAPEDLSRPYRLYSRLHKLWGDLLQVRSDRQLQKLNETIGQLQDER